MYFYFIIALQGFCLYHLFKNKYEYYWWLLILFLPVLGSVIYILLRVLNKRDIDKIQNELESVINPTKKINDLEKRLQFSDSFQNKVDLADAYLENKDYKNAIINYEKSLEDNFQNDFYVMKRLVESFFEIEDYDKVIFYVEKIKQEPEFIQSRTQFIYGLTLEKMERMDEAEVQLRQMDRRYSNYEERLVLASFLLNKSKVNEAKEILDELYTEAQYMTKPNRRKYRITFDEVEKLKNELDAST